MSHVIKLSKPGYNVLTETNPDNLIFSSDYETLKYLPDGNGSIAYGLTPSTSFPLELTVNHNLGYCPFFFAYTDAGAGLSPIQYYPVSYSFADAFGDFAVYAYVTTTQLIFRVESVSGIGGSTTLNIRYQLFRNNLGL